MVVGLEFHYETIAEIVLQGHLARQSVIREAESGQSRWSAARAASNSRWNAGNTLHILSV